MTRPKLYFYEPKYVRDELRKARELAEEVRRHERELVKFLKEIERKKLHLRLGNPSMRPFCEKWLRFTRTQSQRLVTLLRLYEEENLYSDSHELGQHNDSSGPYLHILNPSSNKSTPS